MRYPKDYGLSNFTPLDQDEDMRRLFMESPIVHACFSFYLRRECSWETALKMAVVELAKSNAALGKMVEEMYMQMAPAPIIVKEKK